MLPAGSRLALTVGGRDFEREDGTGSIPFFHRDAGDRPVNLFGGVTTINSGEGESFLLVPTTGDHIIVLSNASRTLRFRNPLAACRFAPR